MNSRGEARNAARACRRVVREVACEWKEAGDRARLLRGCGEEELVLLEEEVSSELDETDPRRLNPFPFAHLAIACSITEGMMLKPIPLEEDEEDELDDDIEAAMDGKGTGT